MPIVRARDLPPMTVATTVSATEVFIPAGEWESAAGVVSAKAWGEVRSLNGGLKVRPAVQLTNDVRSPDSALPIGGQTAADGVIDPAAATVASAGKLWIRVGWLVQLTSGSTLASAAVMGTVVLES